jgi:hypothetical protein
MVRPSAVEPDMTAPDRIGRDYPFLAFATT